MGLEATAYSVLGLEPGADRAAVDEAYRRLIKLYHPDRSGGDAKRAAEINRAYFELRRARGGDARGALEEPAEDLAEAIYQRRAERSRRITRRRRRRRIWPLAALAVGVLLYVERERVMDAGLQLYDAVAPAWTPVLDSAPGSAPAGPSVDLKAPLAEPAIRSSIALATRLADTSEERRAQQSRDCHREMRAEPSIEQLDRCSAFDYAIAMLQDRDPVTDGGPFSASAVTSRQMAAASLLTNDYWEIEARLDRIRGRVELAFAPPPPASPPAPGFSGAAQPSS